MHHTIELVVPTDTTDDTLAKLAAIDGVTQLSVERGASVKPSGDVVKAQVLNRDLDSVLEIAGSARQSGSVSVTNSESQSMLRPHSPTVFAHDGDEAPVDAIARRLRHHGSLSWNYLALMGLGGGIAVAGMLSTPVSQAIAMVAASFVAPAFDALAGMSLGALERNWRFVVRGLLAAVGGFLALAVVSAATYLLLHALGATGPHALTTSPGVENVTRPTSSDWLVSAFGAAAGVVIVSAFRSEIVGGALVAISVVPAAAMVGAGLAAGDIDVTQKALGRFSVNVLFVVGFAVAILFLKQRLAHGTRRPAG